MDGIGLVLVQAIIQHREEEGSCERVEDILLVPGIGPKTLEHIQDRITVE